MKNVFRYAVSLLLFMHTGSMMHACEEGPKLKKTRFVLANQDTTSPVTNQEIVKWLAIVSKKQQKQDKKIQRQAQKIEQQKAELSQYSEYLGKSLSERICSSHEANEKYTKYVGDTILQITGEMAKHLKSEITDLRNLSHARSKCADARFHHLVSSSNENCVITDTRINNLKAEANDFSEQVINQFKKNNDIDNEKNDIHNENLKRICVCINDLDARVNNLESLQQAVPYTQSQKESSLSSNLSNC